MNGLLEILHKNCLLDTFHMNNLLDTFHINQPPKTFHMNYLLGKFHYLIDTFDINRLLSLRQPVLSSTHNICFVLEIRKLFFHYLLLSRDLPKGIKWMDLS